MGDGELGYFTVRMKFSNDGGLLFAHLASLDSNQKRIDRIRHLAALGYLIESGRFAVGTMPTAAVQPIAYQSVPVTIEAEERTTPKTAPLADEEVVPLEALLSLTGMGGELSLQR